MNTVVSKILNSGMKVVSRVNPTLASKIRYKHYLGKPLNLKNPQTLNEKMMYLKLNRYWDQQFVADRADKYAVRKVITEAGCPEILIDLYGVWDRVEDIDWEKLPEKFAIKCNHGSGYNIICKDKSTFDIEDAKKKLSQWMAEEYGVERAEQGIYSKIHKKIIAEKFIETADGMPPKDYKFFCSYGEVKFLFVASDRINNQTKFDYYYPDWTWIPVKNQHPNVGPTEKPKMLELMIRYAQILSKDLPLVRVDLYNEGEQIIFGELTFTHFGCLNSFDPDKYDLIFGQCFPDVAKLK
jgi:hypothetical protein